MLYQCFICFYESSYGYFRPIDTTTPIRLIYDDLVSPEVDSDNQLDESSLFRTDSVQVGGTSGAIHFGEDPEKIEKQLATI